MINRVVVAGRIVAGPRCEDAPGGVRSAVLTLELRHLRWGEHEPAACVVEVQTLGERRVDAVLRYLTQGRDVLVSGHLARHDERLRVVAEQLAFLADGLVTRYLWSEPRAGAVA